MFVFHIYAYIHIRIFFFPLPSWFANVLCRNLIFDELLFVLCECIKVKTWRADAYRVFVVIKYEVCLNRKFDFGNYLY